jgi:hypothetical protein
LTQENKYVQINKLITDILTDIKWKI